MLKARELPRWVQRQAQRHGIEIDHTAAQALVAAVGDRQQRLLREIEKLALEHGKGAKLGLDDIEAVASHSAERPGLGPRRRARRRRPRRRATARSSSCARRASRSPASCRSWPAASARCSASPSASSWASRPGQIKSSVRMPPWKADQAMREARRTDVDSLRRALEALADLELASRGGEELEHDTVALRAIDAIAA